MKKVWIFGGSFCCGYQNGGGARDWIAQLDADVTVWACTPQSPRSQFLMLQHAFCCSKLETKFQTPPDHIIYDYPHANRVDLPTEVPAEKQNMLNCHRYAKSRTGHEFECGCEPDTGPNWGVRSLTLIDEWHKWDKTPAKEQFTRQVKQDVIKGRLPDLSTHRYTQEALDVIKQSGISYSWYSANNSEHLAFSDHLDSYVDIHTLNNSVPTQTYNSKTFNHLSIQQNILWARFFNDLII